MGGSDVNQVIINKVFVARAVAASLTVRSEAIQLSLLRPNGFFSLHVSAVTGTGVARIRYELSNDGGVSYVTPTAATDIVTAHTVTSGPGGDGKDFYGFTPETAEWMRLLITETGGANPITVTAALAIE